MRRLARMLFGYAVLVTAGSSATACTLCFLDPNNAACNSTPKRGTGAAPTQYLRLEPDTVWLVRQGVSANTQISVVTSAADNTNYSLAMLGLPAGLYASFASTSVNRTHPAEVRLGIVSTYQGTDRIDFFGNTTNRQLRGALIVTTVKPFTLGYVGSPVSIQAGAAGSVPFIVSRAAGFSGDVLLSAGVRAPNVVTAMVPGPTPVNAGTATLTVGANVQPGTYPLVLEGTYKSYFDTLAVPVTVTAAPPPVDFSLSLPNNALKIERGRSATTRIDINRSVTSVGAVQLSHGPLPNGVSISFAPNPATNTCDATVSVTTAAASGGPHSIEITGTWQNITRRATLTLTIADPDFALGATATSFTLPRSGGAPTTVTINRLSPVIADINFSTQNVPSGVVVTFSSNPVVAGLVGVGITATSQSSAGTYTFHIVADALDRTGIPLGVRRQLAIQLTIAEPLTLTLTPGALTLTAGGPAVTTQLAVTRNGVTQPVNVSVTNLPNGVTVGSIVPNPQTTSNVAITLAASPAAQTGAPVTALVNATVNSVTQSIPLALTVQASVVSDFQLVPPASVAVPLGGPTRSFALTIVRHASFAGVPIALSASGLPGSTILNVVPNSTSGTSASIDIYVAPNVAPGSYTVTITGTAQGITRTATMIVNVGV